MAASAERFKDLTSAVSQPPIAPNHDANSIPSPSLSASTYATPASSLSNNNQLVTHPFADTSASVDKGTAQLLIPSAEHTSQAPTSRSPSIEKNCCGGYIDCEEEYDEGMGYPSVSGADDRRRMVRIQTSRIRTTSGGNTA